MLVRGSPPPAVSCGNRVDRNRRWQVIHRPRYDDWWSLPKGRLTRGEHPMVGACREVAEKTGVRAPLGPRLGTYQRVLSTTRPPTPLSDLR